MHEEPNPFTKSSDRLLRSKRGFVSKVTALDFNSSGSLLATGALETDVKIWQISPTGADILSKTLTEKQGDISHLAWHPTAANMLASVGNDGFLRLWDTRGSHVSSRIPCNSNNMYCCWHPAGGHIVVTTKSSENIVFDLRKAPEQFKQQYRVEVNQLAIGCDGSTVVQGGGGGVVLVMQWPDLQIIRELRGHNERVDPVVFSKDGRRFATGGYDATAVVWDTETLLPVRSHYNWECNTIGLAFSHDRQFLAVGGNDHSLKINLACSGPHVVEDKASSVRLIQAGKAP